MKIEKVALVMQSLEGGGVQKVMVGLANGFLKTNDDVSVDMIIGDARGAMRTEVSNKVRIIDFDKKKYHGDFKMLASIGRLISYMRRHQNTVMIAAPGFASVAAVVAKIFTHEKVILVVDDRPSLLKSRGVKGWISFILYYMTFRFADAIVAAHSSAATDTAKSLRVDAKKIHTIYHPLIEPELIQKVQPISRELKGFLRKDDALLVAAGRLTGVKDYQNLIKAFGIVAKKQGNVKLTILGEGPDKEELVQLIGAHGLKDRVLMYGYADNLLAFMKKAKICVSSSRQEAFGITLVEALACGVTVVSTDCSSGGPREILDDGEYGYLCPIENPEALAEAIEKALSNPIDRQKAYERGMQFSVGISVEQYRALVRKVAVL